jgi:hypothetical protein
VIRPNQAEQDPVRRKILAAVDRLMDGTPLRSTGRMSVSQLAVAAGVERWHLTHQHVDLKELFQARVKAADGTPAVFARELSELEKLKDKHAKLVAHCTELEERLALYASVINVLVLEKEAGDIGAHVPDLGARRRKRQASPRDQP